MIKYIMKFIALLIWFFLIRDTLYFSTTIPFNVLYILLLLGIKHTAMIWVFMIDILVIALLINSQKTIGKIKGFFQSIKFPLLNLYLIYLAIYSAINFFSFEPFFYEGLYISSRFPFLIVLIFALYLGLRNFSIRRFLTFLLDTKESIRVFLGMKSKAELEEEREKRAAREYRRSTEMKKRIYELNRMTIKQLDSRQDFIDELLYKEYASNTLLTVKRELNKSNKERIVGAAIFTNATQLEHNKVKVHWGNSGSRSDKSRQSADVPGYNFLARKFNYMKDNKRVYIWHRTHLIPFRHTLSEGDTIENLLFAGTAHLNSGARPDIDYEVSNEEEEIDGRPQRVKDLRDKFTIFQEISDSEENIFEKHAKVDMPQDITVPGAPEGSYYCLDDVERAVDEIMLDDPDSNFAYATLLEYENDFLLAPRWCTAVLINKTSKAIVFYIKLSNVK